MKLDYETDAGDVISMDVSDEMVKAARTLAYAPARYFLESTQSFPIAIGSLVCSRARPEGIKNAFIYMSEAYQRLKERRVPILVRPASDGRYTVIDGNSTVAIANLAGWPDVPCTLSPPGE